MSLLLLTAEPAGARGPHRHCAAEAQEQLEQGLTLQGAAAIQDDLVKDVCLSVRRLQAAGIRFWILTGDKPDTAEAIAVRFGERDSL